MMLRRFIAALLLCIGAIDALAHDHWIQRGGHRNAAGEWCCGEGDCFVVSPKSISRDVAGNYLIRQGKAWFRSEVEPPDTFEVIPESEAMPSPDGAYWRCRRPDGTRRCFFAPPPNT